MLLRLVYVSKAVAPDGQDLPSILEKSSENNPALEVTGVLCHLDPVYLQYIEGEESTIDALYERIRTDPRHTDCTTLERRAIPRRAFPDWSMKLLEWNEHTQSIFRSFSPDAAQDLFSADPSTAAPLVRALVRSPDWKFGETP
ncbi:MAG: BLUF domain-containing protein [Gammaproteobacteria bacterium]|nr:BLUF domain-containing protein [Gammaproteobacteria bacterium]MBU1443331.1 BLUF domain-containing protein [Gammaproteobacteria bacterium]MBU2289379.1 BLUF domain-containing protein [Gammaproteobacteria bacterium]MBU2409495.1 BLUF domain-containing protein [Gammaproteobacteria bacterium]